MFCRPEVQQLLLANGVIAAPGAVSQPGMCRAFSSMDEVQSSFPVLQCLVAPEAVWLVVAPWLRDVELRNACCSCKARVVQWYIWCLYCAYRACTAVRKCSWTARCTTGCAGRRLPASASPRCVHGTCSCAWHLQLCNTLRSDDSTAAANAS